VSGATVLHVVVAGEVGGAERMLVDLASGASDRDHVIALMTPSARLRELFVSAGLVVVDRGPVREGPLTYLARSLGPRDASWLADVARRRRAGIVHLHTFGSHVLGTRAALRTRSTRILRTEHSTRVYEDPSCWPFSRWSLRRAHAVVCISDFVARVARAKAPWAAPRMTVVPNGVDVERFVPAESRANTTSRPLRAIALGRLDPRKGLDIALTALARIDGVELDIVGEGGERSRLEALVGRLGLRRRVRFLGFLADVRSAVADADVALSSARTEGLGIALIEAMAMARPVVALPTGGVPELVRDGTTGWLAHGSSPEALARALVDARDRRDEVLRRGQCAREAAVTRFSITAMREGYARVYAEVEAAAP